MVQYVESYTVPDESRHAVARVLWESGPMKPWTLLHESGVDHQAMKKMMLDWEIEINARGDVRLGTH